MGSVRVCFICVLFVFHLPLYSRADAALTTTGVSAVSINGSGCGKCAANKAGKLSCCAPGGAWYKNCGGADNKHVDHKWSEGAAACKRKFNAT